jgi:hypothetical protein
MWEYEQHNGHLSLDGVLVAIGYSGHGDGIDDPAYQFMPDVGPIPQGRYTIGPKFAHPEHGPLCMHLFPDVSNQMMGRDGFLIHGDTKERNRTASHGCVILDLPAREKIAASKDRQLTVVA